MRNMSLLRYISLFSGIGGFDLGFDRAKMQCVLQVEKDEKARAVLAHHWPNVPKMELVENVTRDKVRELGIEAVDVLAGGFPCQDISIQNPNGEGLQGKRSGLWSEYARIICEVRPQWVVIENVRNLLSINNGRDFGRVLWDLARIGYDATWRVIRASDVGAPHIRERVFIVANCDGKRVKGFWEKPIQRFPAFSWLKDVRRVEDLRDRPDLPQPTICRKSNGVSARVDQLGNAVVPQIAEWIGRRITETELTQ